MAKIDSKYFNYYNIGVYCRRTQQWVHSNKGNNMKSETLTYAIAAAILATVIGLVLGSAVNVDAGAVLGWATAGVLLAMAPMNYRKFFKSMIGRA